MVWPQLRIFWLSKYDTTRHSEIKRKKGRQKRWEDNIDIEERTGIDFASSASAANDRTR